MNIYEIKYSTTNTYLIEGTGGRILFDTGWAGTFPAFCRAVGECNIQVQNIDYILISHFHPDHMGIAQEIADLGPVLIVMDVQQNYIHGSDSIFAKDKKHRYVPIRDERVKLLPLSDGRTFLHRLGIEGEILFTPGHSPDSISLVLDDGSCFVGDLNPLYELELHRGTQIEESWKLLLARNLKIIYYGHAKTADLRGSGTEKTITEENSENKEKTANEEKTMKDLHALTLRIMKLIDKKISLDKIQKKTGADRAFIEDVARMYLTHQNVGVQGILDRIEIRGR